MAADAGEAAAGAADPDEGRDRDGPEAVGGGNAQGAPFRQDTRECARRWDMPPGTDEELNLEGPRKGKEHAAVANAMVGPATGVPAETALWVLGTPCDTICITHRRRVYGPFVRDGRAGWPIRAATGPAGWPVGPSAMVAVGQAMPTT